MTEGRTMIIHGGRQFDPFGERWRENWTSVPDAEAEERRRVIAEGTFVLPDGDTLSASSTKRVRARLLGTYAGARAPGYVDGEPGRWLIPDVWRWGHIPMLSGQPRAGKSTLVVDLIASLLIPERRFLDHYPPAPITEGERERGVWLINAENPEPELTAVVESAGLEYWTDNDGFEYDDGSAPGGRFYPKGDSKAWLLVDHLEALGGAWAFDLRDPEIYDRWLSRIADLTCAVCDGRDEAPPLAIIVDGVTAILGSDTTAYGQWYAKFRELMKELGVENALVVVHSPMNGGEAMNGVESIAGADGTWKYQMDNVHNPKSARTFSGSRRLIRGGIEGGRVILGDDGRPRIEGRTRPEANTGTAPEGVSVWESSVLDRLRRVGEHGLMTVEVTGDGKDGTFRRAALKKLHDAGAVTGRKDGKGTRWFLAEVSLAV
ncbi:AAA family ATPase [Microbacterium sp. KSW4-16]|uniref:AAA family ATPase n=1 Tax=Microbacterium aurugineum TaxID=2851642 RepID=UPI0020BF1201|nr:AAA family ATPase [Microbacterium aurugineum]MCK8468088.1 AAA family ATPase [Microbacterium aurugineum]